ncbi:hypothetical protein ACC688_29060 [Rhizobium ruizarguesonis]
MFQFLRKSSACLRIVIASTVSISFTSLQVSAVELDKMFESLEPAYTTMAGAEECDLKLEIGPRLWRYAEMRVKDLETRSGLSYEQLNAKKETAKAEGRQVAGIGACGSVKVAFQVLDELRKATGRPYPPVEPAQTETKMNPGPGASMQSEIDVRSVISDWKTAYIGCRGGFGDEDSTSAACGKRDELAEELAKRGYCEIRSADGAPKWTECRLTK